jgi:outer membrane protein assembly factor BamB
MCNCSGQTAAGCNCTSLTTPVVGFSPQNYTALSSNVTGHLQGIDAELGILQDELDATNFTSPNGTVTIGDEDTLQATFDVTQYAEVGLSVYDALVWTETAGKPLIYNRNANKQIIFEGAVYLTGGIPTLDDWSTIAVISTANDRPTQPIYRTISAIDKDTFVPVQNTTWVMRITTAGLIQIFVDDNTAQSKAYCLHAEYKAAG